MRPLRLLCFALAALLGLLAVVEAMVGSDDAFAWGLFAASAGFALLGEMPAWLGPRGSRPAG